MHETNHHILKEALQCLPLYQAPGIVLDRIFHDLNDLEANDQIAWQVDQLPVYEAPAMVWDQIEQTLEEDVQNSTGRIRKLRFGSLLAIAASFLVIVAAGMYLINGSSKQSVSIAYSQEKKEFSDVSMDWNEDDDEIQEVVTAFSNSILVKNSLDAEDLLYEMEELEDAKKEAVETLAKYGNDAAVITQITQIEKERSTVVKKMVALMLG